MLSCTRGSKFRVRASCLMFLIDVHDTELDVLFVVIVVVDSDGCRYHGLTVMEIAVID